VRALPSVENVTGVAVPDDEYAVNARRVRVRQRERVRRRVLHDVRVPVQLRHADDGRDGDDVAVRQAVRRRRDDAGVRLRDCGNGFRATRAGGDLYQGSLARDGG
jgi:hypothetical protein